MARKRENDWKERLGVVYSTSDEYEYDYNRDEEEDTLPNKEQVLNISLDKKQRKGKQVTLISGFVGSETDLKELGRMLKNKCGVGGSAKDGEVIIQGDFRDKICEILSKEGYKIR